MRRLNGPNSVPAPSQTRYSLSRSHPRPYRLTVIGCTLAWLLVGMHVPALHEMVDHGHAPGRGAIVAVALLACAAVAGLWALLRAPRPNG